MMNNIEAAKIGSRQGLIAVGIGLVTAQFIMTFLSWDKGLIKGFFWFETFDYKLNVFVGAVIMLINGHFWGQLAGKAILIKKQNYILVGFLCSIAVLFTTAFFSGWLGFMQEGIKNISTNDNPFEDYILKPLYWITIFGAIPALLVGIWFGRQIKKALKEK
jgi:hypothetical protein